MQPDRQMSPAEAMMWRLEADPQLNSTFANVTVLDRAPDVESFRRRMERAAQLYPRLHQRVQTTPGNLRPPKWVDDDDFSIDRHVRVVHLTNGTDRALFDLAGLIAVTPFDRTRPLWEFTLVDGLKDGKGAIVQKMHHTVADGETSVKLSLQFLDLERDAPEPPPIRPDDLPTPDLGTDHDPIGDLVHQAVHLPSTVVRTLRDLLADPEAAVAKGAQALDMVRGVVSQLSDTDRARSPLWTSRSLDRRLETLRAPFLPTKQTAKALGGTINTALLTVAADAAGRYHRALGSPVDELRASMAVSTRTSTSGSNAFSLARMLVPTDDMPIADRFARIVEITEHARHSVTGGASLDSLATAALALPTAVLTRLARQQAETVDFATSNVKAAPFACYIARALVLHNFPIGPLGGVAFNLTLLSYNGTLDMGINLDPQAVTDPKLLRTSMEKSWKALLKHAPRAATT